MAEMFQVSLEARPNNEEQFFGLLADLEHIHACGTIRYDLEKQEINFHGRVDTVTANTLLTLFRSVPDHLTIATRV